MALPCIVREPLADLQEQERTDQDDDEQHPGHGGGVSHLEPEEGILVKVDAVEQGGVQRVTEAMAAAENVSLGKILEHPNHASDQIEERDG